MYDEEYEYPNKAMDLAGLVTLYLSVVRNLSKKVLP